ncbi:MAG: DUF1501 domain-containing protein, partial [Bacteroidales bacterium]|nr:DUF1501 domain-containing protein [Bacteroidales bacterium]
LTLPQLLQASGTTPRRNSSADCVIFLHQWGGAGQHETFDMKPDAPDNVRGWFQPMPSRLPGLPVCEKLPRVAQIADKLCVIRCMQHNMRNHNSAGYYSLTGVAPPSDDQRLRDTNDLFPAFGSIVSKLAPGPKGTAAFVSFPHVIADGSITPGQAASFLGKSHNPLFVGEDPNKPDFRLPELSLPQGLTADRLGNRTEILRLIDEQSELMEQSAIARGLDESYQKAVAMLTAPGFKAAFDLSQEPASVRDRYGRTTYGQSCLLARRLAEAGAKFINVYFARSIGGTGGGWDYHGFRGENVVGRLNELLPITDQTLSALITDLSDRGMLERTLVVWVGEFGRTPRISGNGGRDHWPQCYTAVLAGGGTKAGFVYGASDKIGAFPTEGKASPEDLAATMFAALGLDPGTEIRDALDRPLPISRGEPIHAVWA